MDKYDKQIAKINKKKQKALEKQAKIQAELDQMTDEDLKYQRAIRVGKINVAKSIKDIFGLVIPFSVIASMILPFSNLMLGLLLGVGGLSLVTAIGASLVEVLNEQEWLKYNKEILNREAKQKEIKLQEELHQDLSQDKQTLISRKVVEQNLEKQEELSK